MGGLQVNGSNYLVPVDAVLETETDLEFETVRPDVILNQLERRPRNIRGQYIYFHPQDSGRRTEQQKCR